MALLWLQQVRTTEQTVWEGTYKFWSTYTRAHTSALTSLGAHTSAHTSVGAHTSFGAHTIEIEFGSTYERSYVRFFAPGPYMFTPPVA